MRDNFKYKMKGTGKKKPVAEGKSGQELHAATGRWRDRDFQVDRQNERDKRIRERIVDQASGQIVREYDEPLEKHTGHGTKPKRKQRP